MFLLLLCFSLHGFATITLFETLYARGRILNSILDQTGSRWREAKKNNRKASEGWNLTNSSQFRKSI